MKWMLRDRYITFLKDPLWLKVSTLALILFFVFLSDAILSYWVPNFFDRVFDDTSKVGLVMGFSSVIGLLADLVLPQLIRGISVRKLIMWSIILSLIFSLFLYLSALTSFIILMLLSMATWGIYYELLAFAQHQFVADATPIRLHPAAWGVLGVFRSTAYFLGPILAGGLLLGSESFPLFMAILFALISFVILSFSKKEHDRPLVIEVDKVNIFTEFKHWTSLLQHVWPVIIMSIFIGVIDAVFWSVGAIYTEDLSQTSFLGGLFLSLYMLPSLFIGFVVAKWGIYKGKKKMAEKFLFATGVFYAFMGLTNNILVISFLTFLGSTMISVSIPLIDGVYSDIVARMGRERKHMIGLSSSTSSLAYIFGPAIGGLIAGMVGSKNTFTVLGVTAICVSIFLLLVTPRKLHLPQEEIREWRD
jgi:MFS family permease